MKMPHIFFIFPFLKSLRGLLPPCPPHVAAPAYKYHTFVSENTAGPSHSIKHNKKSQTVASYFLFLLKASQHTIINYSIIQFDICFQLFILTCSGLSLFIDINYTMGFDCRAGPQWSTTLSAPSRSRSMTNSQLTLFKRTSCQKFPTFHKFS